MNVTYFQSILLPAQHCRGREGGRVRRENSLLPSHLWSLSFPICKIRIMISVCCIEMYQDSMGK